ncbi:MAG: LLM class flavin-dependent oxidoreductase, partial [Mycobacterium sp.]
GAMTELCGEVADGMLAHPFTSKRYLDEMTMPALRRGMKRSGRDRSEFQLSCSLLVVAGANEAEFQTAADSVRKQLAFYGSTPAYRTVLELHGWEDLQPELRRLSLQGEWDTMGSLIDDEMLDAFAVVAAPDELADKIRDRCGGVIDRILPGFPSHMSDTAVSAVLKELRQ